MVSEKALNELHFGSIMHVFWIQRVSKTCFTSSLNITTDASSVEYGGYISKENRSVPKNENAKGTCILIYHESVVPFWKWYLEENPGCSFERILRFLLEVDVIEMVDPGCKRDYQGCLQKSTPGSESSALLLPEASTVFNTGGCLNGSKCTGSWTESEIKTVQLDLNLRQFIECSEAIYNFFTKIT
jgi:hypothetical protein